MKISVRHHTIYRYDQPVYFGVQRLHLRPDSNALQHVDEWAIDLDGASEQLSYSDQFGNITDLIKLAPNTEQVRIAVNGVVETNDQAGVYGYDPDPLPMWFYRSTLGYTARGPRSTRLTERFAKAHTDEIPDVAMFHELSNTIRDAVEYTVGGTGVDTTAEEALVCGQGVCQDHAHIMISVCRQLGYPARYVSGYLLMDGVVEQAASHAWCEVYLDRLGWVGFDVSNGISPDGRYVRLGVGRDYGDVPPVHGIRYGVAAEVLDVELQVQQ